MGNQHAKKASVSFHSFSPIVAGSTSSLSVATAPTPTPSQHSDSHTPSWDEDVTENDDDDDEVDALAIPFEDIFDMQAHGTGPLGTVYRARYMNRNVAVKTFDAKLVSRARGSDSLSNTDIFRNQVSIIGMLPTHENVIAFEGMCANMALVTELMDANLEDIIYKQRLPLSWVDKIRLCLNIATGMEHLHKNNMVHGNLKPKNVLLEVHEDGTIGMVKVGDFGLHIFHRNTLSGPYTAPEQIINRIPDKSGDVYPFGIIMFEVLMGRIPYEGLQRDEIVSKVSVDPNFRPSLRDFVKDETHGRIQSQFIDLMRDCWDHSPANRPTYHDISLQLQDLLDQINNPSHVSRFIRLSERRHRAVFNIPNRLYGRDIEMAVVKDLFTQMDSSGRRGVSLQNLCRFLLVSGPSGIGKSSFIYELFQELTGILNQEVFSFCSGKYNQYSNHIPYSAIVQAFATVTEANIIGPSVKNPKVMKAWKQKLLRALGKNGQLIIDVLPEIEIVIGKQKPVPELAPEEAQSRFLQTFYYFVGTLATQHHKFVLFFDDLQWADPISFKLIERLVLNPNLFIVGAYRDNEVSEGHPLFRAIDSLKKITRVHAMTLAPLSLRDLARMCADTLHSLDIQDTLPLATLIDSKTSGNPFFFRHFFSMLYQGKLVEYNPDKDQWTWNLDDIREITDSCSDNVVDLMIVKLKQLSHNAQSLLKIASCLGVSFDHTVLSAVCQNVHLEDGKTIGAITTESPVLQECINLGYLTITRAASSASTERNTSKTDHRPISMAVATPLNSDVIYQFSHDRVQQAANQLWKNWAAIGRQVQLEIGRILKNVKDIDADTNTLFEVSANLAAGAELINNKRELLEVVEICYRAAQRATKTAAYVKALKFAQDGLDILFKHIPKFVSSQSTNSTYVVWDDPACYHLCVKMSLLGETLEYLNKNVTAGDRHFAELKKQARSPVTVSEAYTIKSKQLLNEGRYAECVLLLSGFFDKEQAARYAYKGVKDDEVMALVSSIKKTLEMKNFEPISRAVLTDDPRETLPELNILMEMCVCLAFVGSQIEFLYLISRMIEICLNATGYKIPRIAFHSYIRLAYNIVIKNPSPEIFRFAIKIAETVCGHPEFRANRVPESMFGYYGFSQMWSHPIIKSTKYLLREVLPSCLENGSQLYAAFSIMMYCQMAPYVCDKQLSSTLHKFDELKKACEHHNMIFGVMAIKACSVVRILVDSSCEQEFSAIETELFKFPPATQRHQYLILRALAMHILGRYERGLEAVIKSYGHSRPTTSDIASQALVWTLEVLLRCRVIEINHKRRPEPTPRDKEFLSTSTTVIEQRIAKLKLFTEHAHEANFSHYLSLATAELARLKRDVPDDIIMRYYKDAIEKANSNGFIVFEAIASEALGSFFEEIGMTGRTRDCLAQALQLFEKWGALVKVRSLQEKLLSMAQFSNGPTDTDSPITPLSASIFSKPEPAVVQPKEKTVYEMLHLVMKDAQHHDALRRRLEKQFAADFNVENWFFLLKLQDYRRGDTRQRATIARDIFTLYIREESPMTLNIDANERNAIRKVVEATSSMSDSESLLPKFVSMLDDNLFRDVESSALMNLRDSFAAFSETDFFKKMYGPSAVKRSSNRYKPKK